MSTAEVMRRPKPYQAQMTAGIPIEGMRVARVNLRPPKRVFPRGERLSEKANPDVTAHPFTEIQRS